MEYIEQVSGTKINILNSNGDNTNSVKLLGNTEQNTYEGKNLYDFKKTVSVTGGAAVDGDGWITATYNNTSGSSTIFCNYFTENLNLKENTRYNIIVEVKNVSGTGRLFVCSVNGDTQGQFNGSEEMNFSSLQSGSIVNRLRTTKSSLTNVTQGLRTFVAFFAGNSGSITFRLSVLEDTTVTPETFEYEPYVGEVPSPSPDYPQLIKTVKGVTNLYDYSYRRGGNIDIRTVNCTCVEEDGVFTMVTSGTGDSYIWEVIRSGSNYNSANAGQLFEFEEDVYLLKISDSTMYNQFITYYDENKVSLGYVYRSSNIVNISKKDKIGAKYFSIRIGQASALGAGVTHTFTIQLVPGSGITYDFVPYGKYKSFIKQYKKNLLDTSRNLGDTLFVDTATGNFQRGTVWSQYPAVPLESNTTYTLSSDYKESNNSFEISFFDKDFKWLSASQISLTNGYMTFTTDDKQAYLLVGYRKDRINGNKIQLEKGSVSTEYEPYDVKTYEIDMTKENLFDKNNVISNVSIDSAGAIIPDTHSKVYYIPVVSGKECIMHQGYSRQYVYTFSEDIPQIGSVTGSRVIVSSAENVVATVPDNCNYLLVREYSTLANEQNETLIVTEGNQIYHELCKIGDYQDSFIKGTGKNLLKIPTSVSKTFNGITYKVNDDGSVTIKGTATTGSGFTVDLDNPIELDGRYTMSLKCVGTTNANANQQWLLRAADNTSIFSPTIGSNTTKSQSDNRNITATKLEIATAANAIIDMTVYPQLEKNNTYTEWEPYGAKGKWLLHKEIEKVVFDGSENWQQWSTTESISRYALNMSSTIKKPSSNETPGAILADCFSTRTGTQTYQANVGISIMASGYLAIYDGLSTTLSAWKTYLSNNNVTVYYVLDTPTSTLITDTNLIKQLNNLYSMELPYGTTYIESQGNLPAILDITYNNWNKDINPSDRAALLDGTATIETKIEFHNENLFDKTQVESTNLNNWTVEQIENGLKITHKNSYATGRPEFTTTLKSNTNYTLSMDLGEHTTENPFVDIYLNGTWKTSYYVAQEESEIFTTDSTGNVNIRFSGIAANTYTKFLNIRLEETPMILTQDNSVISWNHEDFRYVKDQGFIGQFVARQVTGELKNISDDFNITDKEFELKLGVRTNNNTNWYSLGNFLVTKVTDDEVKDKTSFEALDYTKIFNKEYEDRVTYPCTALDLALDVCDQCGIELATINFKNYDYVIDANVFTNNESCRDVMKEIGKLAFSWVRIDWDNKVYLDFNKQTQVIENNSANNSQYYNLTTQKENFGPVNRIIIGYSQIEGERTKIEDAQSIEENGVYELTIYDNPLVYNQSQRESIINSARDLLGLSYKPLNTLTIGHPWLKGKELFEITDMEDNKYNTIPFDRTIQYFGHIKTLIDVATPTKTNTEYAYTKSIEKTAQNAEIQVKKATGDINALTSRTAILENEAGNTYTIEQVNQLIQNAETGVTNTFSEAGGNNIFRNTGLWFENSERRVIGKNLLRTPQSISRTADGITYTVNDDGSITMSGTAQNGQGIIVDLSEIIQINEENCCFSVKCIGTNTPDNSIIVALGNQSVSQLDPETMRHMEVFVKNNSTQYTVSTIDKIKAINIAAIPNTVINCTLYLQLEKGSSYTDWEPYTTAENPYEFWSGPVVKQKEESAANMNALLLQQGTLSQEQDVPNGNYTISFKYKKLITLSNVKCVINDVEYTLDNTEETEFTQVIGVSSQHINIKFVTDIDDSCEIYDLMVNAGSVKLAYSQNQNETTTDTVNISKGITITSTDTNTTFKADSDGIRVFNSRDLDDPVTEFVDTGMETNRAVIKDEAQIVGVLVQQVGSQTWFTRL